MGNRWVIGMGWGSGDGFQGWVPGVGYRGGMGQRGTGNGTAVGQCEWAAAPGPTQNGDGNGAWIPTGTPNGVCELRGPLGTAVGGGGQRSSAGPRQEMWAGRGGRGGRRRMWGDRGGFGGVGAAPPRGGVPVGPYLSPARGRSRHHEAGGDGGDGGDGDGGDPEQRSATASAMPSARPGRGTGQSAPHSAALTGAPPPPPPGGPPVSPPPGVPLCHHPQGSARVAPPSVPAWPRGSPYGTTPPLQPGRGGSPRHPPTPRGPFVSPLPPSQPGPGAPLV